VTKAQTQLDVIYTVEALVAAAIAFEDDPDIEKMILFEDQEAYDPDLLANDMSEILEISVLNHFRLCQIRPQ
jgi:hypothetical protein